MAYLNGLGVVLNPAATPIYNRLMATGKYYSAAANKEYATTATPVTPSVPVGMRPYFTGAMPAPKPVTVATPGGGTYFDVINRPAVMKVAELATAASQGKPIYQLPDGTLTTAIPPGMSIIGAPVVPPAAPVAAPVPAPTAGGAVVPAPTAGGAVVPAPTAGGAVVPQISVPPPPFDMPGGAASFMPGDQASEQQIAEPVKTGLMQGYSPFIIGGAALLALFLMKRKRK